MRNYDNSVDILEFSVLAILIIITSYFRIYHAPLGWFIHDSARDMTFAYAIAKGESYPCLGPTAAQIFYLGPLYYYILSLPLFFIKNIIAPYYFIAFLNALSVILTYMFTKRFFGRDAAILSSFLYACFPFAILTGRNMWNPALLPPFTMLFFFSLFCLLSGNKKFLMFLLPLLAILTQLHFSTVCLFLFLGFIFYRRLFSSRYFCIGLALAILTYVPYIYYEIFHNFENVRHLSGWLIACLQDHSYQEALRILPDALFLYPRLSSALGIPPYFKGLFLIENLLWLLGLIYYAIKLLTKKINTKELVILLWFVVPFIITVFFRRDFFGFYYLDPIYPAQFILLSMFLIKITSYFKSPLKNTLLTMIGLGLILNSAVCVFYYDRNLNKTGYHSFKRKVINIGGLEQNGLIILPTLNAKLIFWESVLKIYPFTYNQVLNHIHGPEAYFLRDQDNRFLCSYYTKEKKEPHMPPELLVMLGKKGSSYPELFNIGDFHIFKIKPYYMACEPLFPSVESYPLLNQVFISTPFFLGEKIGQKSFATLNIT